MNRTNKTILFCFCGPGGSGKSTICTKLLEQEPHNKQLVLSISSTSRPPRPGEVHGKDYFFLSKTEFEDRINRQMFLEYAEFNGNYYGTDLEVYSRAENSNCDLLFDIDTQGVKLLKQLYNTQCVCIFVYPPSFADLQRRITDRKTDSPEVIAKRLTLAKQELAVLHSPGFSDYLLVNDCLDCSVELAQAIIAAERLRYSQQKPNYLNLLRSDSL